MSTPAAAIGSLVSSRATSRRPVIVAVAGGVASGKSTLAVALVEALRDWKVEVVTTDGFLFPNSALAARGLTNRKGFPESYDLDALRTFLEGTRAGGLPRPVPWYSHTIYDVDGQRIVAAADVLVVEGVNALAAAPDLVDIGVYVDVDETLLETWFRQRFLELCAAAGDDPTSFYRTFSGWSETEIVATATQVWRDVNLVNLREHIAPSRIYAHCVITMGADHEVLSVVVRDDAAATGGDRDDH